MVTCTNICRGGKIAGQFTTVKGIGDGVNAQLVGQEIDVINNRPADSEEHYTTAGMQIVTIGTADSTAAIELISDWTSRWRHGIMIDEGAIAEDGTILACGQQDLMKIGIDLSNSIFSDSAILLNNDQCIKFEGTSFDVGSGLIYMSDDDQIVIQIGNKGLTVTTNDGLENILRITGEGEIAEDCMLYKRYIANSNNLQTVNLGKSIIPFCILGVCIVLLFLILCAQNKRIQMLEKG